ncbi:MAG TPA: DUF4177 domain-containing protein [Pyrinomonadaceae bacterium]|nr:DUF4177 domain-containing protein [Pyrinomonadaceae bacterium]
MKWEYKTVKIRANSFLPEQPEIFELTEIDEFINQFGQLGWELVSTQGIIGQWSPTSTLVITKEIILFFKRPLSS